MGSKKSTTTTRTDLPDWLTAAGQQATSMGMQIGSRVYGGYHGQRIANLSGNERTALNLAASGNGRAQQFMEQGANLLAATKSWDQATDAERKAYEEPIFNSITRPAIDQANSQYGRQRTNLSTNAAMIQAKGNDNLALREKALDRNLNETVGDVQDQGRYQAFEAARQQWGADQQMMQSVAEAYRAAGGDLSRLNAQQIQELMMTGGAERVLEQAGLDYDYGRFLENRDWSVNNLGPLLAALRGASPHTDTTVYGKQKDKGGEIGQIIGLGSTLAGSFYNWGGNSNLAGAKISPQSTYQPTSAINSTYNPNLWSQPGQQMNA